MICPRCNTKMHDQVVNNLASSYHGNETQNNLLPAHWSCWNCGHLEHKPVEAKPLNTKEKCGTFMANAGNYRQESQEEAKMRCEDYFDKFKHHFHAELAKARTFKSIWIEVKENNINLPSRSWLKKRYTDWMKE